MILKKYSKVVSIEVFSYDDLTTSLQFLEKSWQRFTLNTKEEKE